MVAAGGPYCKVDGSEELQGFAERACGIFLHGAERFCDIVLAELFGVVGVSANQPFRRYVEYFSLLVYEVRLADILPF